MVISIETTIAHPRRGFIKLEDTVAVTDAGWEAFGDRGRAGTGLAAARSVIVEALFLVRGGFVLELLDRRSKVFQRGGVLRA